MCHESEDGKNNRSGEEGSERVDATDADCVTINIVVELVVGPQSQQCSDSDAIREENLRTTVDPAFAHCEAVPIRREEIFNSIKSSGKSERLDTENAQDDVGKHGREPNNLKSK